MIDLIPSLLFWVGIACLIPQISPRHVGVALVGFGSLLGSKRMSG